MNGKRTRPPLTAPDKQDTDSVNQHPMPAKPHPAATAPAPAKPQRKRRPRFVL